jgi:S-formylglutathione hydrolase FrmB
MEHAVDNVRVTASTVRYAAESPSWVDGMVGLSLMHGLIPLVLQAICICSIMLAIGRRTRRWRLVWLPVGVVVGVLLAVWAQWYIRSHGLSGDRPPFILWLWIGCLGLAATVLLAGWRDSRWWRRVVSVLAVPLSILCVAASVNTWVGYVPTVSAAWNELTSGPLPDQIDRASLSALQESGVRPTKGAVVSVTIPATASHFKHRDELVYLPPAWLATNPAPRLPAVMMIGGEFNTPTDWLRAGNAVVALDAFAAAHDGNAPVVVFVDSGGGFNVDTECVNGPRGNAADHLTKDVVPYMNSQFGVSPDPANWGIVGFSAGGTCAVDLTTMHPELFHSFVDIAGDIAPNSGNQAQTLTRLYGGNTEAYKQFDPSTVITKHRRYQGISALFIVSGARLDNQKQPSGGDKAELGAAKTLCDLGSHNGIRCAVEAQPGRHDWPFAGRAFETALPWLAGQVGTPGVAPLPMPSSTPATSPAIEASARPQGH